MNKAVLISIRPEWCQMITNGTKTVEVRKTRPKLQPPFKVFIYCTMASTTDPKNYLELHRNGKSLKMNGHIIGEFICDRIVDFRIFEDGAVQYWGFADLDKSCLTYEEIANYVGKGKRGHAWHISRLWIYDQPKSLDSFRRACNKSHDTSCFLCNRFRAASMTCNNRLTQPPQSWGYVIEVGEMPSEQGHCY